MDESKKLEVLVHYNYALNLAMLEDYSRAMSDVQGIEIETIKKRIEDKAIAILKQEWPHLPDVKEFGFKLAKDIATLTPPKVRIPAISPFDLKVPS